MKEQREEREYQFPLMLKRVMMAHPDTGKPTTQKALAEAVGIRAQTISLYINGETQPNIETLLKIADYFGVSTDWLLTGVSAESIDINDYTGLSEEAIKMLNNMNLIEKVSGVVSMPLLNSILADKSFYRFLDDIVCRGESLMKLRQMTDREIKQLYPGVDMLGYAEWSFTNEIQRFITDFLRKRGIIDGEHK